MGEPYRIIARTLPEHIHVKPFPTGTQCQSIKHLGVTTPCQRQYILSIDDAITIRIPIFEIADHFTAASKLTVLDGRVKQFVIRLELAYFIIHPYDVAPAISLTTTPPVHAIDKRPPFHLLIHCPGKIEIPTNIKPDIANGFGIAERKFQPTGP